MYINKLPTKLIAVTFSPLLVVKFIFLIKFLSLISTYKQITTFLWNIL